MKQFVILVTSLLFATVISLPVTPNKAKEKEHKEPEKTEDPEVRNICCVKQVVLSLTC